MKHLTSIISRETVASNIATVQWFTRSKNSNIHETAWIKIREHKYFIGEQEQEQQEIAGEQQEQEYIKPLWDQVVSRGSVISFMNEQGIEQQGIIHSLFILKNSRETGEYSIADPDLKSINVLRDSFINIPVNAIVFKYGNRIEQIA